MLIPMKLKVKYDDTDVKEMLEKKELSPTEVIKFLAAYKGFIRGICKEIDDATLRVDIVKLTIKDEERIDL